MPRPTVSLGPDGTILSIEFGDGAADGRCGTEFYAGILVPGLVNAHCHLELSALRGAIPRGGGFTAFARAIGPARRAVAEGEAFRAAAAADASMRAAGVAAVGDVCNSALTFPLKGGAEETYAEGPRAGDEGRIRLPGGAERKQAGGANTAAPIYGGRISYTSFAELYGLGHRDASGAEPLAAAARAAGLRHSVTPHSLYSLGDAAFGAAVACGADAGAGGDACGKAPLSVHFMESPAEAQLYARRGELWEWYEAQGLRPDFLHYGSPVRRLVESVPSGRDIMLVHDTFVTEEDIETVESHFTGRVTWVLCPGSNAYISGAAPPAELLRLKGVRIALGTDSLASNDALDMAAEMCLLPEVPLEELLVWATAGGAEGLNLDGRFGEAEAGRRCGLALLEGADMRRMRPAPGMRFRRLA